MKRGIIAIMMVFASMTAFAQRDMAKMTPEARAENQTKTLTENLKLTEEQQKKVYNLNLSRAQKMEEMRKSKDADRTKMKESMEAYNTELSKVLTPEQQEKYKTAMKERRTDGGMGRGPRK
jgi:Spy/CpxP family protein refolding chaperone